jgi:hemerythrin-like domain-containing protein
VIQIGTGLPPVAEEPLEHLVACHDRILQRLETLERVGENFDAQPEAAVQALYRTLDFFNTSGRLHTEDEEESVFPRIREHIGAAGIEYLDALEEQHRQKEAVYDQLRRLAGELRESVTPERVATYRNVAGQLCDLYRAHIASENEVLVRMGHEALSSEELASIREEMRSRRRS